MGCYQLTLRPREGELTEDMFVSYFNEQEDFSFPDDEPMIAEYVRSRTGTYFHFTYVPANMDEPRGALLFIINYFRPFVFALEAEPRLRAVVNALDLEVEDKQIDGIEGAEYDRSAFLRGWTTGNRLAYASIFENGADSWADATLDVRIGDSRPFLMPRAELEGIWRFNDEGDAIWEANGGYYGVPAIGFADRDEELLTFTILDLTKARGFLIPRVDVVFVQRGDEEGAFVPWQDIETTLELSQDEVESDPWPYWAIPGGLLEPKLARFLHGHMEPAPFKGIRPEAVHATEDVEVVLSRLRSERLR